MLSELNIDEDAFDIFVTFNAMEKIEFLSDAMEFGIDAAMLTQFGKITDNLKYAADTAYIAKRVNAYPKIEDQLEFAESSIAEKWVYIKDNGISKSLFIGNLIYNLFFIAIYNAILALFLRRKNEIA